MKITYDKTVDALNVSLRRGSVAQTLEVAPEIFIDVDTKGRTLNIEIIGAREKVGVRNFNTVTVGTKNIPLPATV